MEGKIEWTPTLSHSAIAMHQRSPVFLLPISSQSYTLGASKITKIVCIQAETFALLYLQTHVHRQRQRHVAC